jgi:hypothetical protein
MRKRHDRRPQRRPEHGRTGRSPNEAPERHDASFLHLETPEMPMHVGSLNVFDLPEDYEGDFYEGVRAHIASRMHLASVFESKLAQMPFELSNPVWVDDNDIDLDYHLRRVVLSKPGTFKQLEQLVGPAFEPARSQPPCGVLRDRGWRPGSPPPLQCITPPSTDRPAWRWPGPSTI